MGATVGVQTLDVSCTPTPTPTPTPTEAAVTTTSVSGTTTTLFAIDPNLPLPRTGGDPSAATALGIAALLMGLALLSIVAFSRFRTTRQ